MISNFINILQFIGLIILWIKFYGSDKNGSIKSGATLDDTKKKLRTSTFQSLPVARLSLA